jgi:hypothetical protein
MSKTVTILNGLMPGEDPWLAWVFPCGHRYTVYFDTSSRDYDWDTGGLKCPRCFPDRNKFYRRSPEGWVLWVPERWTLEDAQEKGAKHD